MTQVLPAFSSQAGSTSVWHRIRQATCLSSARWIMSGWLPHSTMLSGPSNSRFSQSWGRAMDTEPLTLSTRSPPSPMIRPSMTLNRLNRGMASTRGSPTVFRLKVAISPADSIPYREPSSLTTGMAEIFCSRMSFHARSMVTEASRHGGRSKSRSFTCVRTFWIKRGGLKWNRSSIRLVSSLTVPRWTATYSFSPSAFFSAA